MNYRYIGDFDTDSIVTKLKDITQEDWEDFNFRADQEKVHRQTLTIPLFYYFYAGTDQERLITTDEKWSILFTDELNTLKDIGANAYPKGGLIRCLLVKLEAGGRIPLHIDTWINPSANSIHRVHIPVITNDDVIFSVGGELKNMKKGECWEINNLEEKHGVNNYSSTDRVHLIFDWET